MTLIKNISPLGDLDVPALGRVVAFGESVDVSDALLDSFISQSANWEAVAYAPAQVSIPTPSTTDVETPDASAPVTN